MAAEPQPSATVVLLRDARDAPEVLLLQRAPRRDGKPGPWVFPGGKVERDEAQRSGGDVLAAAREAAVRETAEEAGLALVADSLLPISRWITPEVSPRRFDTWFFLGLVGGDVDVRVDGGEIVDHRWLRASDALAEHHAGRVRLAPPTFVTVTWLEPHPHAQAAQRALAAEELVTFRPRICPQEDGACILYPGDAGYELGDPLVAGPRHRLWSLPGGYRYERRG
jgi:8-oxo-dGTP pyrophosphatase MutT (NUDIX family)